MRIKPGTWVWLAAMTVQVCAMRHDLVAQTSPNAAGTEMERFEDRQPVAADAMAQHLTKSWIIARLNSGGRIDLWDIRMEAREDSVVLCGLSSQYIFSAVLKGRVASSKGLIANAGQTFFWEHAGSSDLRVFDFSAKDLSQSFTSSGRQDLADLLQPVTQWQGLQRFWGLLRPTGMNVSMPANPVVEDVRKSYLTQPEVIAAKRSATKVGELADNVAREFLVALIKRDADAVGQLITPAFFRDAAKAGKLQEARREFAATLLGQPWVRSVDPASLHQTESFLDYRFRAGSGEFSLKMEIFDNSVFVSAVGEAKKP